MADEHHVVVSGHFLSDSEAATDMRFDSECGQQIRRRADPPEFLGQTLARQTRACIEVGCHVLEGPRVFIPVPILGQGGGSVGLALLVAEHDEPVRLIERQWVQNRVKYAEDRRRRSDPEGQSCHGYGRKGSLP